MTFRRARREPILMLEHKAARLRLRGSAEFSGPDGARWTIAPMPEKADRRLGLWDPRGDCQAFLLWIGDGSMGRLIVAERGRRQFQGLLSARFETAMGQRAFACRARPPLEGDVAQMASGPADSLLNDSIFDIDRDCLLRLGGGAVRIETIPSPDGRAPRFVVRMEAQADDPARNTLEFEALPDFFRRFHAPWYRPIPREREGKPATGWMSWNTYFDSAGEKETLDEARTAAKWLKPYGLRVWSIESWQEASFGPARHFRNLTLKAEPTQFPHGMKWLADRIRELGFTPGIWTNPFGTGSQEFYEQRKSWFLHDRQGRPMSNWTGDYLLDPSQPAVRAHMRRTHEIMSREWGYEFFKIDGLSHNNSSYSALFYERPQVRAAFRRPCENPLERCVKACRQGMGPDRYFLACRGFHNGPEAALADATRIGGDVVQPHKPVTWEGYLSQARMTLARLFSHNIQWHSDPDTLLVGTAAPLAAARTAATVVALPGQLMFAGDKLMELPEERMRLLQRCLPVCPVRPLDLFPIMRLKPVWTLKIRRDFGAWDVVSLFNFRDDEPCEAAVGMEELGLDPAKRYWVWDFWADKLLGAKRGELRLKLKPMANALLAVHEDLGRPQFLSTDRHLTQGGVSLTALEWDAAKLELRGETQLVAGEATTLALLCPPPYRPLEASSEGAAAGAALERAKNVLRLRLKPRATGDAHWTVRFALMP